MKTTAHVHFFIRIKGEHSSFSQSAWDGYNQRLLAKDRGELAPDELVYGPAQARAHIKQLRKHRYDGRRPYQHSTFEVVRETTVQTVDEEVAS